MKKVILFLAVVVLFTACVFDFKSNKKEIKADSVHVDSLTVKK
jgi:hypothetical protein